MDNVEMEGAASERETSIEGTLLMLDDKTPHVAVPVQAICDGQVFATTLSDESGKYQFANLKPGQYQLRCHVLNGYVYYKAADHALLFTSYDSEATESVVEDGPGDILDVTRGKTLSNIDFRFAPFKKGTWRHYGPFDGLAHDTANRIFVEPDGIMWFGTDFGLSRYDGKQFVNFTTRDGLGVGDIWAIHRDPDGVMWFGTGFGGVSRYDGKEFVTFTSEDGLAGDSVFAIHRDPDGVMWFGGWRGAGVSRYDGREFVNFTTEDGLASDSIHAIHRGPDGVLWFATANGISCYDGEEFLSFTTKDGLVDNDVWAIHRDPDGVLWFGTYGGVSRYDGKGFVNFATQDGLAGDWIRAIDRDADGVMWIGTWGGGMSRYDGKTFVNFTKEDGLPCNVVKDIHVDRDGVMWIGTGTVASAKRGGISRYDTETFVNFTTKDGLPNDAVSDIHIAPDGVVWIGTRGGVSRYDGGKFANFTVEDGLASNRVTTIESGPDGALWFGTGAFFASQPGSGVSRYDGEKFITFTTEDGLADDHISTIYCDPDGVMWFGTFGSGVSRYDGKQFATFTAEDGLGGAKYPISNWVVAVYRDPDGAMWFGTWSGVSRYDGKEFINYTREDGLAGGLVGAICHDRDGILWFGTHRDGILWFGTRGGGVSRYDGKRFVTFSTEDGLAGNIVRSIYCDSHGVLWFGTDSKGVSGYDGTAWTSLDTRDGLAGNKVNSICQDADGFLWFGTNGGLTRYRRSMTPPKVRIASVTTDQTYRLTTQDSRLKSESPSIPAFNVGTRVTIEYYALDFKTIPEKRQYRCRVYETSDMRPQTSDSSLKSQVSSLPYNSPTRETSFDWIPEEPGTYIFEVQAIDRDLNYSEPASVELRVVPDPRNHRIIQLEEHIRQQELAELERIHRELEDARRIQQSLLPEEPPEVKGFEIADISLPAREVSGDFYDYLPLGDNIGIVLADVTGKSVKAAMVAALADGMLSEETKRGRELWNSPGMILRELNMGLQTRLVRGMFTAMSLCIIHAGGKHLVFSNAGMPYPIVKRGNEVWELEVNGIPLGLMENAEYEDLSADLEGGDFVVFYSDGVIEAENEAGDMYQTERVLELIQNADPGLSAQKILDLIVKDVTEFTGDVELSDDITIVVMQCREC